MTTISVKDQIKRLVELQIIDVEIYRSKAQVKEKPAEIAALNADFEAKKARLKQFEEELKAIQLAQKANEGDLKSKEDAIVKADGQLAQLKTNKEYSAKLLEIEGIKADKSLIEEKILIGFDQIEAARKAVDTERTVVASFEKEFGAKKKQIEDEVAVAQDQIKVKESQRSQLTPDVRPDVLARYDRILQNKEGLAIVAVNNQSCGGCFMHLTEQRVNEIKRHDQIITCDMCARIVYLPDEL